MALRVQGFILRYVCTNGAVVGDPMAGTQDGLIHYNVSREDLFAYLESGVAHVAAQLPRIREMLSRSVRAEAPKLAKVRWRLDSILGGSGGKAFLRAFPTDEKVRLYDLFNYITDRAKQGSALTRFRLEEYAGSLLTGLAGGGRN